ncbi:hypothetical protein B0H13DRAFT_1888192 [Mycena leptocephala]|nr:hypothetical protein B0H13DRAFT_1888192 [Mycena leptocephala]
MTYTVGVLKGKSKGAGIPFPRKLKGWEGTQNTKRALVIPEPKHASPCIDFTLLALERDPLDNYNSVHYSFISDFPTALAICLNEAVYITLLAISALGAFGAIRGKADQVRIFKNVVTIHFPASICLGIWLLVLVCRASLKGPVKAAAVALLIIVWGLESIALVVTTHWLVWGDHRDNKKNEVQTIQGKPIPSSASNTAGEEYHYWNFELPQLGSCSVVNDST